MCALADNAIDDFLSRKTIRRNTQSPITERQFRGPIDEWNSSHRCVQDVNDDDVHEQSIAPRFGGVSFEGQINSWGLEFESKGVRRPQRRNVFGWALRRIGRSCRGGSFRFRSQDSPSEKFLKPLTQHNATHSCAHSSLVGLTLNQSVDEQKILFVLCLACSIDFYVALFTMRSTQLAAVAFRCSPSTWSCLCVCVCVFFMTMQMSFWRSP